MSVECKRCSGKSQTYLCARCQVALTELLEGLAIGTELPDGRMSRPWLQCLEDARLGDTRLGESARRSTERNTPLPVHLGASQLYDDITATLQHWCEVVSSNTETLTIPGKDEA